MQEVGSPARPSLILIVLIVEEHYWEQNAKEHEADVERHEVRAREEARKGVQAKDVDGTIDSQEDKEGACGITTHACTLCQILS